MIITKLHCGLGNQMFQYAAGLSLAHRHKTVQKLDVSWFRHYQGMADHNQYGLHCFNIIEQFATSEEVAQLSKTSSNRLSNWKNRLFGSSAAQLSRKHVAPAVDYYPEFSGLPDMTYLDGYFQSEQFFSSVEDVLRAHFTFRLPPTREVSRMADLILASPEPAFLHVRRGDYATLYQDKFGVLGGAYYQKSIRALKERCPSLTVFVFSDDIAAVEKELRLDVPHHFVRATEHHNFYDKIRLMSLCSHAIISNSTFAWWGAWLIPNKEKIVIAPKPWFVGEDLNKLEIVPASWTQVSRANLDSLIIPNIS